LEIFTALEADEIWPLTGIFRGIQTEPLWDQVSFNQNPKIKQSRIAQNLAELRAEEQSLAFKPNFQLGLDFWAIQGRTDASPEGNGRNVLSPNLGIQIPLYREKYRANVARQTKMQQALNQQELAQKQLLSLRLEQIASAWKQGQAKLIQLNEEIQLVEKLNKIKKSELENDLTDLSQFIQVQQKVWRLQIQVLAQHQKLLQLENALAFLNSKNIDQIQRILSSISPNIQTKDR
jgi:outer membrane protein TolC